MTKKIIAIFIVLLLLVSLAETKKKIKQTSKKERRRHDNNQHEEPHFLTPDKLQFWLNALLATFLSLAGGFCSGMTVGLSSLSTLNLEIMVKGEDEVNKKMAERILSVINDHHLFLVTLLVGNAVVLESLPLVIHTIMPDWAAILFSTIIVLVVAEVVPMSLSTGSRKYVIAYYGTPLVALMIKLLWPICYPIARGLDALLGKEHEERIQRRDFLTFINDKQKNFLEQLEIQFINQVMNDKNKSIKEIMISKENAFTLEENQLVDEQVIKDISTKQYSFIPVYRKDVRHIVGYVSSKEVIMNYLVINNKEIQPLKKLIKGKISYKAVSVYSDAVAIEALGVLEASKAQVLLVSQQEKHSREGQSNESLRAISFFSSSEWIVPSEESNHIGFITLHQVLHDIADYRASTLKILHRKLSHEPEQDIEI